MISSDALVQICKDIGNRTPVWTQGTGGNVSLKFDSEKWIQIKASGLRLDQVSLKQGLVQLARFQLTEKLDQLSEEKVQTTQPLENFSLEAQYSRLIGELSAIHGNGQRASMETGFHARLPKSYVFHFHSLVSLLMADDWFEGKSDFLNLQEAVPLEEMGFLNFCLPGLDLSEQSLRFQRNHVIILRNHGVILQADDQSILDAWKNFEEAYCQLRGYETLRNLISTPACLRSSIEKFGDLVLPFRIYFPDTAVFMDRMPAILDLTEPAAQEKHYRLSSSAWISDPNAAELWLASAILYTTKPSLKQWPEPMTAEICNLPIEQWRKQKL